MLLTCNNLWLVYVVYIDFEAFNHISVDVNSGFEQIDSKQLSLFDVL